MVVGTGSVLVVVGSVVGVGMSAKIRNALITFSIQYKSTLNKTVLTEETYAPHS